MLADLRYAVRTLLGGRLFTAVVVTCLALGIAANTMMFSVFDAMFLRPLPFRDASHLLSIAGRDPETGRRGALSLDDLRTIAPALQTVRDLAAYSGRTVTLADDGDPGRIPAQMVTANLFETIGAYPQLGHGFDAADDRLAAEGVAIISDALWHRRYGGASTVIGRIVRLDGAPYRIIGVMPPKFLFPSRSELWIPLTPALGASGAASRAISIVGRLGQDATLVRANAEMASRVLEPRGSRGRRTAWARIFGTTSVGSEERTITGALMGATTVLLLIACVNVANLLLARGAGRRREIAVRSALGASRGRIVRQLLIESVLLSLVAAAVALPLAWCGINWVHRAVPPTDPLGPYYIDWALDLRTFAYAMATGLVTGLGFGLAPALQAAGRRLVHPLREQAGTATSRTQRRAHSALIVVQLALAVALLAGASLFVRTYAGLRGVELGYDTGHLMTYRVYFTGTAYDAAEPRQRAIDDIATRLATLPGAHAATVSDLVPLDDQGGFDAPVGVEGRPFDKGHEPTVQFAGVAGRWPETFDLSLVAGRTFLDQELQSKAPVALVNTTLADTFWPGQNPLGRRFRIAEDDVSPWLTVIGVVPSIRTVKLDESMPTPPTAYIPHRFVITRNYGIIVRTIGAPESVTAGVRAVVRAVDPSLALFDVYPMEQVRWLSYWMYVMWGTLFAWFGGITLVMAAIGVYGVVFYTVAQRTREIGVRVALGASRAQVVGPLMRQIAGLALLGLAGGLLVALWITPIVGNLLIGVEPRDPAGFAAAAVLLGGAALVATWLPSWRASAVNPVVALRDQ